MNPSGASLKPGNGARPSRRLRIARLDALSGGASSPHPTAMPRRAAIKPRTPIPRGRRVHTLLLPEHFATALAAAGVNSLPAGQALEAAASAADPFVQAALSAQVSPPIPTLRETRIALAAVETSCREALAPIMTALPALPEPDETTLARTLVNSQDPLVVALLDAAAGLEGGDADGRLVASTLLAVDRLRRWVGASGVQFDAGVSRERKSRAAPEARSPARDLGFALIRIYIELTGQQPRFSRNTGKDGKIRLTGPLIRYLEHFFGAAREQLRAIPGQAELAGDRGWMPSPETLAAWIKEFRKTSAG